MAQARVFLANGDYRSAWLSVRQAWLINSNNVEACFIMAELDGRGAFARHAGLVPAAGEIIPRHHQQASAGLRGTAVSKPALSAHEPGARRFVRVRRHERAGLSHCFRGNGFEPASDGGGGNPF